MSSRRRDVNPVQQLGGRDGWDGAVCEVGEIASRNHIHAGRLRAADRDVVLEVAARQGCRVFQNGLIHRHDIEGGEAISNTAQCERLADQFSGDVEQVRDGGCHHMTVNLLTVVRVPHC